MADYQLNYNGRKINELLEKVDNITITNNSITDGTNTLSITGKQDTLIAGDNITIENNVISASGGGGGSGSGSVSINNGVKLIFILSGACGVNVTGFCSTDTYGSTIMNYYSYSNSYTATEHQEALYNFNFGTIETSGGYDEISLEINGCSIEDITSGTSFYGSTENFDDYFDGKHLLRIRPYSNPSGTPYIKITMVKTYSSTCCFDAGTQILMADGTTKNIEDVVVGDIVKSYNEEAKEFMTSEIKKLITKHNSNDLVYLNFEDGTQLGMRAYHPLLTTNGWKSLRPEIANTTHKENDENYTMLEIGDEVITINGTTKLVEIIERENPTGDYLTYNLDVEEIDNFIANGVVAHNSPCVG